MSQDDLLARIIDDTATPAAPTLAAWLAESRRFRDFAERYTGKIRKKLRTARDPETLKDLLFELEIARRLSNDPRIVIDYERQAPEGGRAPDFAISFRERITVHIEARRVQLTERLVRANEDGDTDPVTAKLMWILADKAGQMQPGAINVIALRGDAPIYPDEIAGATKALIALAEKKAERYFTQRHFKSAADFLKHFRLISAIAVLNEDGAILWANPMAKFPLPKDLAVLLQAL